jgi:hypothetical protein
MGCVHIQYDLDILSGAFLNTEVSYTQVAGFAFNANSYLELCFRHATHKFVNFQMRPGSQPYRKTLVIFPLMSYFAVLVCISFR